MKSGSDMTPWFPPEIKPVYVGVYLTVGAGMLEAWSKWNGNAWLIDTFRLELASGVEQVSMLQERKWRGLAQKP